MQSFRFSAEKLPAEAEETRVAIRAFLDGELEAGRFVPHRTSWTTFDAGFSRRAGAAGFIGLTMPKAYGGHDRSGLVRFVVTEEMLAAGAPCGAHWIADRQSGPQILRHGTEAAKRAILPGICRGECSFGIGMSEPNSGSDLAAVRTRAVRDGDDWVINGSKIWTTNAHQVDYLLALVRTGEPGPDRHGGLTQFIVDMAVPGVTVRPILDLSGHHEFNEVFFTDYRVPDAMRVGAEGAGWDLVTEELAFERSGPDRFLSDYRLLVELIDRIGPDPDRFQAVETGRMVAQLTALLGMSASVARLLDQGIVPGVEAALVKDVGNGFERAVPEIARRLVPVEPSLTAQGDAFREALGGVTLRAPSFTLRGGTREVLRGVIARGLGLR
ncbi:alkylation response protein AidB-like acyl-CoA dehydrogenase [Methylobacterium brachiatum]|uniref:Alkylation response protein AidB-like acyl-CoA dehydrogenase n=1 Tax=Methylobacterium brachiatum TaxID=269660 RepID=A0AAJ1TZU4_9HYPH|nr:acyl-CoA dehydrogenase family protein [Methylobacterium brachiatum]MCB4805577.1 acyl-CoA dehydrogenase family protein [Methylobacterium brachiatum]MDQ0546773.1 alkylation response protein AidB-like acyl-CoA dehydrogenase [Methylobacterium brachiatum]